MHMFAFIKEFYYLPFWWNFSYWFKIVFNLFLIKGNVKRIIDFNMKKWDPKYLISS